MEKNGETLWDFPQTVRKYKKEPIIPKKYYKWKIYRLDDTEKWISYLEDRMIEITHSE